MLSTLAAFTLDQFIVLGVQRIHTLLEQFLGNADLIQIMLKVLEHLKPCGLMGSSFHQQALNDTDSRFHVPMKSSQGRFKMLPALYGTLDVLGHITRAEVRHAGILNNGEYIP
ncbi:hypothetical protein [Deinococcus rubellus]|uniref:Uncharacterized protein n=1 Tax=Deinococcus rubellus TaxID=1889240 RepID=A0ABY5YKE0_9DEIO|nr:hypothetical protein [Deinococcus rubellus]UWX64734.1 hypothetical protein N0D28_03485 [Deinococcus rubellus]